MRFPAVLFAILLLSGCACGYHPHHDAYRAMPEPVDHSRVHQLADKDAVIETVNQLFISTDKKDWERVTALFAPSVLFDMTSLTGGSPATMTPHQIVESWEKGLKPLKAVHHQSGDFIVTVNGDQADAFCYATATHYLPTKSGKNVRTFVGSYDFHLEKRDGVWWINKFKFNLKYIDGNKDLEKDV